MKVNVCLVCKSVDLSLFATARDIEYFSLEESFSYLKCSTCGSLSISPVPKEKINIIYPKNYYSYKKSSETLIDKIKFKLDQRMFDRALKEINRPEIKVLDVGGGDGWLLGILKKTKQKICQFQIVDLDAEAGKRAVLNGYSFFCGKIEEFDTNEKYDLILMLNLIEHVANPGVVLEKVSRLLSSDGILLLKTPNIDSLDMKIFKHGNWGGYHCPRHWVLFNIDSLTQLMVES